MVDQKNLVISAAVITIFIMGVVIWDNSFEESIVKGQIGTLISNSPFTSHSIPCLKRDEISESYSSVSEQLQELRSHIQRAIEKSHGESALSEFSFDQLFPDTSLVSTADLSQPCVPLRTVIESNKAILKKLHELKEFVENNKERLSGESPVGEDLGTASLRFKDLFRDFLNEQDKPAEAADSRASFPIAEQEPPPYTGSDRPKYAVAGLRTLAAGEEGALTVDTLGAVRPDTADEFVRVLFYGVAVAAPHAWAGDAAGVWAARFRLADPGVYRVHVESLRAPAGPGAPATARPVEGSPFALLVRPAGSEGQSDEQVLPNVSRSTIRETPPGSRRLRGARTRTRAAPQSRFRRPRPRVSALHGPARDASESSGARPPPAARPSSLPLPPFPPGPSARPPFLALGAHALGPPFESRSPPPPQ